MKDIELPEPVGFRSRYRSEPWMIGHYPWTYADHRWRKYDRPECEYEDLYTADQLRAAVEADRAQRVPDGWVLIATDAYEAGFGKGEQAHKTGKDVENPWGDEPGREAWAMGYALGKERAASTPAPAQQECWCEKCDLAQGNPLGRTRMSLCPECGDKRCPRAKHHDNACAHHQEPPQQERKPMTEELVDYILQDDIHNRLTPRVVDIAYSAFVIGRSGQNKDDGGPCDWFNDTKPMVMEQLKKIRKDMNLDAHGIKE